MPQPDSTLVAFPKSPPPARRPRDPRIDAFRGLALVMIFIDHVPGNPYEGWTIRNWGFSDAAEGFFVMSGVAAGIAYSGRFLAPELARHGLWEAVAPMWKRAWTLYLVHLFLTVWAIGIFVWGAQTFYAPELLEKINLRQLFENTRETLLGFPTLGHQLGYVNILPAYSVLLLAGPAMIWLGLRRPWLLAALSAALWVAAGLWRLNLPNYPNPGGWFFNPVAWQAVFVTGLLTGIFLRRGERFVPKSPWLLTAALGVLLFVLAWRYVPELGPWLNRQMARAGAAGVPFNFVSHDKTFLAAPRLIHVLALVYVLSYPDWIRRACASALGAPFRLLGRQGLLVFSAGTLMALFCQVLMTADGSGASGWLAWLLPPLGVAVMLIAAHLGDLRRPRPGGPPAGSATHAGADGPSRRVRTGGVVSAAD